MPAGGSTRARRAVPDEARRLDASSPRVPTPGGARPVRPEPFRSARASPRDAVRARSGPSIARVHPRAERWTRGGVDATEETRGSSFKPLSDASRVSRRHDVSEITACVSARPRCDRSPITRPRLRVNNLGQFLRIRVKTQPRRVKIFAATVRPSRIGTASARRDWLIMPRWATGFANWQFVELFSPFFCFFATESPPEALISTE